MQNLCDQNYGVVIIIQTATIFIVEQWYYNNGHQKVVTSNSFWKN